MHCKFLNHCADLSARIFAGDQGTAACCAFLSLKHDQVLRFYVDQSTEQTRLLSKDTWHKDVRK